MRASRMGLLLAEVARAERGGVGEGLLGRHWVTALLLLANVLVFAASLASGGALLEAGAKVCGARARGAAGDSSAPPRPICGRRGPAPRPEPDLARGGRAGTFRAAAKPPGEADWERG